MKQKALFLDRDGVINIDHNYVGTIDRFELQDGIIPLMQTAQDCGYRLVVTTNQAGVARGYYTEEDFHVVTRHMLAQLAGQGIAIDVVMGCFEHPDGKVAAYTRQSYWRKPNPGMILDAAQRLDIDLARSVFIGDQITDMQAAQAAGIGKSLLLGQQVSEDMPSVIAVADLEAAVAVINDALLVA